MNRKLILRVVAGAALLTAASALHAPRAEAATRKFCYELLFKDDRNDCPVAGDGGVRRACQQKNMNFVDAPDGTYTNPVGQIFEVWTRMPAGSTNTSAAGTSGTPGRAASRSSGRTRPTARARPTPTPTSCGAPG
jgi:hypothetical protein